jgi:hypothetical protein
MPPVNLTPEEIEKYKQQAEQALRPGNMPPGFQTPKGSGTPKPDDATPQWTPPPKPLTDIDRLRALAEGSTSFADPAYRKRVDEQKTRISALSRSNLGMGAGSRQQMASNAQAIMTQGTNFNAKQLQLREQDDARAALAAAVAAQQAGDLEASSMLLDSLKQKYENRDAPGTPWWLTSAGSVAGPAAGWYIQQQQQQGQAQTVDALSRANRGY